MSAQEASLGVTYDGRNWSSVLDLTKALHCERNGDTLTVEFFDARPNLVVRVGDTVERFASGRVTVTPASPAEAVKLPPINLDLKPSSPPNCAETADSPLYRQLRDAVVAYVVAWDAKDRADCAHERASRGERDGWNDYVAIRAREKARAFSALRRMVGLEVEP